jgi:hypothetical protein
LCRIDMTGSSDIGSVGCPAGRPLVTTPHGIRATAIAMSYF